MHNWGLVALSGSGWLCTARRVVVGSHVGVGSFRGSGRLWEAVRGTVGRVMRMCVCVYACACVRVGSWVALGGSVWGRVVSWGLGRLSGCLGSLWVSGGTGSGSGWLSLGGWSGTSRQGLKSIVMCGCDITTHSLHTHS